MARRGVKHAAAYPCQPGLIADRGLFGQSANPHSALLEISVRYRRRACREFLCLEVQIACTSEAMS